MRRFLVLSALSVGIAASCTKDQPITSEGSVDGGGAVGGSDGGGDVEGGDGGDDDGGGSETEPDRLLWDDEVSGVISTPGEVDERVFAAAGGEFIRLNTTSDDAVDIVLVLRDSLGKVVAWSDGYPTGASVNGADAVIYAWLETAGDYTVQVETIESYTGEGDATGGADHTYTLQLTEWSQHTLDDDSEDAPSLELALTGSNTWYAIGVALEASGDVDHVALNVPWGGAAIVIDGIQDHVGADVNAHVRLLDADGNTMSARDGVGPDGPVFYPDLDEGSYRLELGDASGAGGAGEWMYAFVNVDAENSAWPAESEPNDSSGVSTLVDLEEFENSSGKLYSRGEIQGEHDAGEDVDWFQIDAPYDESYAVVCVNSARWGAAAVPDLAIVNASGETLGEVVGDPDASPNARIENVVLPQGTWYLRVSPTDGAAGGVDHWWRARVYVASFAVSSYEDGGYSCP